MNRFPGAPADPAQGHARFNGHIGRSHSTRGFNPLSPFCKTVLELNLDDAHYCVILRGCLLPLNPLCLLLMHKGYCDD